jgi:hypothetical protein
MSETEISILLLNFLFFMNEFREGTYPSILKSSNLFGLHYLSSSLHTYKKTAI